MTTLRGVARLGWALALAAGCTAILDPERIDEVARCRLDQDCPEPDDVRYVNVCTVAGDDEDPDFPKICAPRPSVSCNPHDYDHDSEFFRRAREAEDHEDMYENRCDELGAVQGCLPDDPDECMFGLAPHPASKRCDDDDPDSPPALSPEPSVAGQDVRDQFCRSVFCDGRFTCDTRTDTCVVCTLGAPIGRGGCGDLYPGGERSPVYLDDDEMNAACGGPDGDPQDAALGDFAQ